MDELEEAPRGEGRHQADNGREHEQADKCFAPAAAVGSGETGASGIERNLPLRGRASRPAHMRASLASDPGEATIRDVAPDPSIADKPWG